MKGYKALYWPAIGLAFVVLALDQLSKYWTQHNLPLMQYFHSYPFGGVPVFRNWFGVDFALVHATNKGAAWSLFSNYQLGLVWLRIAMVGGLIAYWLMNRHSRMYQVALLLIIAGAVGNIFDYFIYGHVIDMLYFNLWGYDYPVFNIADSVIFIGVFGLILTSFCSKCKSAEARNR